MVHGAIRIDDWLKLPSAKLVSVRRISEGPVPEASVRYLDEDGAMGPGEFDVRLEWLQAHAERVQRAGRAVA